MKLIDFGTTKLASVDSLAKSAKGTYEYFSPEVSAHWRCANCWSAGLLCALCCAPWADGRATPVLRAAQMWRAHKAESNKQPHTPPPPPLTPYDGMKVDSWCIGITLFVMLCGAYTSIDRVEGLRRTADGTLGTHIMENFDYFMRHKGLQVSPECRDFIAKCLIFDTTARPTPEQLMTHAWMQGSGLTPTVRAARRAACMRQPRNGTHALTASLASLASQAPGAVVLDAATTASIADIMHRLKHYL